MGNPQCSKSGSSSSGGKPYLLERVEKEDLRFLYGKLIEARNFHYDNFTKWQTFFYVAIGAVLVAYGSVVTDGETCRCLGSEQSADIKALLKKMLPCLGFVFSMIWLCSSKGYTYWWNAYMNAVKKFEWKNILGYAGKRDENGEETFERNGNERFEVFLSPRFPKNYDCEHLISGGANFSTSRLANVFAFISAWAWGIVAMATFRPELMELSLKGVVLILSPFLVIAVSLPLLSCLWFGSDLKDFRKEGDKESCPCCYCASVCFVFASVAVIVRPPVFYSGTGWFFENIALFEIWLSASIILSGFAKKICKICSAKNSDK